MKDFPEMLKRYQEYVARERLQKTVFDKEITPALRDPQGL